MLVGETLVTRTARLPLSSARRPPLGCRGSRRPAPPLLQTIPQRPRLS